MRAGFTDSEGHKVWSVLAFALPSLALAFSMFGPIASDRAIVMGFAACGVLHLVGALDLRQRKPRIAEIECGPGFIKVTKAGTRNQRISAKDITGATTARGTSGPILTLQHRKRRTPITLELADDAEVEKVRHALGIGHGGFGQLTWATEVDPAKRGKFTGNILGAIAGLGIAAFLLLGKTGPGGAELMVLASMLFGLVGFVATIMAFVGALSPFAQPSIAMTASGIRLRTPRGWFALPYEALRTIDETPDQLVFGVPEPFNWVVVNKTSPAPGGLSANDRSIVTSQLMAASQRARGLGPLKNDVTGRVDVLRRNGENPRAWLVRLDMAGEMLAAGSGYRGNTLDAEDLWAILEDPEAEAELRAAAARVLRHLRAPETRVRIDAALAAVRDEPTNRRLRIAVSDNLDAASDELSVLEVEERAVWTAPAQQMYHRT